MLHSSKHRLAACTAIVATFLAAAAHGATPGEVDPTFGQNGRTVVADNSEAIGLTLPDGSLLVASHVRDTPADLELRRFDSEGHADLNFGVAGVAHHEFAVFADLMQSVARAPDGRVYFGGSTARHGRVDMAVFAVDAQGAAVPTFGDGGLLIYDLVDSENTGAFDNTAALAVMPDGRLLAAGFSADNNGHDYGFEASDRRPQLLRLNVDGSLERTVDLRQFNGHASVCAGITGLLRRADSSILVGDDTGIYAFPDGALQTLGADGGVVRDENWNPHPAACLGLRSFGTTPSGELLTVSVFNLSDGQLGFALKRLHGDGSRIAGLAQAPPVPLARLVGQDARFAGVSSIWHVLMSPPMQSAADDRVYILFEFSSDLGEGWAIARLATDGALDTGWGTNGVVCLEKEADTLYWTSVPALLESPPDGRIVAMSGNGVLTRLLGGSREGHGAINIDAGRDVGEDAGQVSIEVTRTGGSAGAVSVEYSTTDELYGPATEGEDFTPVSGRLDWADGDSSPREIVIPILEDTLAESSEHFNVDIRSPSGGAVLLNTRAPMAINDDGDTSTPPPPPPPNESSGGGGATDAATLILLNSLIALSVARRRRMDASARRTARNSGHSVPGGAS
jgi:uncharacterized delta-60 repeat protein